MVEQAPVQQEAKPEPPAPAAAPIGTGIAGNGSDGFGLGQGGGNGFGRSGNGRVAGKWDGYAVEVQDSITDALRKDKRTRNASLKVKLRIWPDGAGRIARAKVAGNQTPEAQDVTAVLTDLKLPKPPPAGMPLPIVMTLSETRPK